MLVLTRKCQEKIQIGENITITIVRVKGQSVRVGIDAPREIKVVRTELPPEPSCGDGVEQSEDAPADRCSAAEPRAESDPTTGRLPSEGRDCRASYHPASTCGAGHRQAERPLGSRIAPVASLVSA